MWKAGRQVPMITSFIFSSNLMVSYLDIAAVMYLFLALVMAVPNADIVEVGGRRFGAACRREKPINCKARLTHLPLLL